MRPTLREFLEIALRAFGCAVQPEEENLLRVGVPEGWLNRLLDVGGSTYLALVEYEDDILAGREPVRFVFPGSYYFDLLTNRLCGEGIVADVELPARSNPPDVAAVEAAVRSALREPDRLELDECRPRAHRCVTFHFWIDLLAAEPTRELVSVTWDVDAAATLPDPDHADLHAPPGPPVRLTRQEIGQAYQHAVREARVAARRAAKEYCQTHGDYRRAAAERNEREREQDLRRFDESLPVLYARGATGEEVQASRREIERDWARRLDHVRSQYTAEAVNVTLVAATRQIRPFHHYTVRVSSPVGCGFVECQADAYSGRLLGPTCVGCCDRGGPLRLGEAPCFHPYCPRCEPAPLPCGHRLCPTCVSVCPGEGCRTSLCLRCAATCGVCGTRCCARHLGNCRDCGRRLCARDGNRCGDCEATFCGDCWPAHQEAVFGCGHSTCISPSTCCAVCADKLCPRCAAVCRECRRGVCAAHRNECVVCEQVICNEHVTRCHICDGACCPSDGTNCWHCQAFVCAEHLSECDQCDAFLCEGCWDHECSVVACFTCRAKHPVEQLRECRYCEQLFCAQHAASVTDRDVGGGGEENDRPGGEPWVCGVCVNQDQPSPAVACFACRAGTPPAQVAGCSDCGREFCPDCLAQCVRCGQGVCHDDGYFCPSCHQWYCDRHWDEHIYGHAGGKKPNGSQGGRSARP